MIRFRELGFEYTVCENSTWDVGLAFDVYIQVARYGLGFL